MGEYVISPDVLAALCIYAEARGEPFSGQVAVGEVIRNRMFRKYHSDGSIAGTIFRPWQFSWVNTEDPQRARIFRTFDDDPAFERAQEAWAKSADHLIIEDAVLYHNDTVVPSWAQRARFVRQIGRHFFYGDP